MIGLNLGLAVVFVVVVLCTLTSPLEETFLPGMVMDHAAAALPPAFTTKWLHSGFGHHHFGSSRT